MCSVSAVAACPDLRGGQGVADLSSHSEGITCPAGGDGARGVQLGVLGRHDHCRYTVRRPSTHEATALPPSIFMSPSFVQVLTFAPLVQEGVCVCVCVCVLKCKCLWYDCSSSAGGVWQH